MRGHDGALHFHLRNVRRSGLLPVRVQVWMTSRHRRNGSRRAAVAVMISLWVAIWALEVSPGLHRLLHEDAESPGHHCLVTQFQHHLLLPGFVAALAPALPDSSHALIRSGDFQFYPSYDYRLSPSRAPPSV